MLSPQFRPHYQPKLPGMASKPEQMALFATRSLGDGTTRGSYFAPGASPDDMAASRAHLDVKPSEFGTQFRPPENHLEYGTVSEEGHRAHSDNAADPYTRVNSPESRWPMPDNVDLRADLAGPPGDFEDQSQRLLGLLGVGNGARTPETAHPDTPTGRYAANRYLPTTDRLVDGGREHLNNLKSGDKGSAFWDKFAGGTDFGDNALRATPTPFTDMEFDDDGDTYAAFTPDGEQAAGMAYSESEVLPDAESINGAGVGSAFTRRGIGKMTASRMAAERNDSGIFVHGNSFTSDGNRSFQQKGAAGESSLESAVEAEYLASGAEYIVDSYDTYDLAEEAGVDYDDDDSAADPLDDYELAQTIIDNGSSRGWGSSGMAGEAVEYAKGVVQSDKLQEQRTLLGGARPYLGLSDRAPGRSQWEPQPRDVAMLDESGLDARAMVSPPPKHDEGYYARSTWDSSTNRALRPEGPRPSTDANPRLRGGTGTPVPRLPRAVTSRGVARGPLAASAPAASPPDADADRIAELLGVGPRAPSRNESRTGSFVREGLDFLNDDGSLL